MPQPDQKQTAEQQSRTVVIQGYRRNEDQPPAVKINQENVRWEDLEGSLARIYLTRAEKVLSCGAPMSISNIWPT